MEMGLINNEKELTMTFVRDKVVVKNMFGETLYFRMFMGKKTSPIPTFD